MASAPTPSEIHVLLVDDEGVSRTMVARVLRNCSYRVTEVGDGVEAIRVLKESLRGRREDRFHLLLTDVVMPEVDGLSLLRFVRSHEALRNLPVVMMSAHEQADTVFECIRGGAEDYLLKPIKKKEVQHIWQHVWRRNTQAQTVPSLNEDGNQDNDARLMLMSVPQQKQQSGSGTPNASEIVPEVKNEGACVSLEPAKETDPETKKTMPTGMSSLLAYLRRDGRVVSKRECLYIFRELLSHVARLHASGMLLGKHWSAVVTICPSIGVYVQLVTADQMHRLEAFDDMCDYASPEVIAGSNATRLSDLYSLGLVLFQLFHPLHSSDDPAEQLANARRGSFPDDFLKEFPQVARVCQLMVRPVVTERLSMDDLISSDAMNDMQHEFGDQICRQPTAARSKNPHTWFFLHAVWHHERVASQKLTNEIEMIEKDIASIRSTLELRTDVPTHTRKRQKLGDSNIPEHTVSPRLNKMQANFEELDLFWYNQRLKHASSEKDNQLDVQRLGDLSVDLSKFVRFNSLKCKATLQQVDLLNNMEMICSMCFDRDDEFFAATGVCKKIKIYEYKCVVQEGMEGHLPVADIACTSKLNSLAWSSYIKSHIASADCAGTVSLWDVASLCPVVQYNEHTSRAWSVDLSPTDPTRLLSGSDDGSIRLWSLCQQNSVGRVDCNANICSVQFSPVDAHTFAAGTTDHRAYLFDARNLSRPTAVLGGHRNSIAYVRFLSPNTLVTSSTDNSLKLWDLKGISPSDPLTNAVRTFSGHQNEKNFVGLSVHREGYIASGSEDNSVVAYHKSFSSPMVSSKFHGVNPLTGRREADDRGQFVSSLAFQHAGNVLLAANSAGIIKVLELA